MYLPCCHGVWLWDDGPLLLNNPVLRPGGVARAWLVPGSYLNYWPVTYTVYWIGFHLWGLHPLGFHLLNIGLHAITALLVWRVLEALELPGALLAAAIFALHPVNVENVAWVAQLRGILSLAWALVCVLFYLKHEQYGGRWRYSLAILAFLLSALSKGEALTLPIVLLALAWWRHGRIGREDIRRLLPLVFIAICMAGVEVWSQHSLDSASGCGSDGFFSRSAIAGMAVWFYFGKFVWPFNLVPIYPRWSINPANLLCYVPGCLLLGILVAAWWHRRGWGRPVATVIICYVALLLPVLGFVNITYMQFSLVADHWQYTAMVVLCAAAGAAIATLAGRSWRHWPAMSCCLALVLGLGYLTWQQNYLYGDHELYYRTTIAKNPTCWKAEDLLGESLAEREQWNTAIVHYRRALALNPDCPEAHGDIAIAFAARGEFDLAEKHFKRVIELNPRAPDIHYELALVYASTGELGKMIPILQQELEINSSHESARKVLSRTLARREQLQIVLSEVLRRLKQTPKDPALLDQAAWLLAASPFDSLRDGSRAVAMAELASKITGGNDPQNLGSLAAAYAEVGRFDDAVTAAERGQVLAERDGNTQLAGELSVCLMRYKNGKPTRDMR